MSGFAIVRPLPIAAVSASRGAGDQNLLTRDPKEAWIDSASGSNVTLTIDLGAAVTIDTVMLGYVRLADPASYWTVTGGVNGAADAIIQPWTLLRVPDIAGDLAIRTHALWTGGAVTVRYLALTLSQPQGAPPLSAGVLAIGRAFAPAMGQEWSDGRQPIDTGTATALPSGGFAIIEGARKISYSWTFGDLSAAEADQLQLIALGCGETAPAVVIEDTAATPGLRARIHYGLFKSWKAFERRNRAQTRWELTLEEWV